MRDELTFSASDKDVAPESPMLFTTKSKPREQWKQQSNRQIQINNWWINLESFWQWSSSFITYKILKKGKERRKKDGKALPYKDISVRDELTFNPSEKDIIPESPKLLLKEWIKRKWNVM